MDTQKNISYIQNAQDKESQGVRSMSSVEIAELTEKQHGHIIRDIKNMMAAINPNMDALDYKGVLVDRREDNGQIKVINPSKDLTITLVSGYSVVMRHRIITRWQELESAQQAPAPRELSRMDLIKLAMEAEQERLLLAAKVEEMEPTVAAYDRLTNAENTVTMTDAAKQLKLKPSQLREWMVTHKWIYKLGGAKAWTAHQDRIDSGCMMRKTTTVERDGETSIYSQARVTAKGLATISKAIEKARKTAMIVGVAA